LYFEKGNFAGKKITWQRRLFDCSSLAFGKLDFLETRPKRTTERSNEENGTIKISSQIITAKINLQTFQSRSPKHPSDPHLNLNDQQKNSHATSTFNSVPNSNRAHEGRPNAIHFQFLIILIRSTLEFGINRNNLENHLQDR
jgi:hypothetical protein